MSSKYNLNPYMNSCNDANPYSNNTIIETFQNPKNISCSDGNPFKFNCKSGKNFKKRVSSIHEIEQENPPDWLDENFYRYDEPYYYEEKEIDDYERVAEEYMLTHPRGSI